MLSRRTLPPHGPVSDTLGLTAYESARLIENGSWTSEHLVSSCLERVSAREDDVKAWAYIGYEEALLEARQRDRELRRGLLHGVPIAVKDLSDTATMPTEYGSPAYAGHRPVSDAACVALARAAGAVILGKTATVEFGATRPCGTTNPHNRLNTPGGSSSGSAAVVADGQVPLATGTQTGGSIIRPAAFCGVVGFKPTFGAISPVGTKAYSWSLDTVGMLASSAADAALFFDVLRGASASQRLPDTIPNPRIGMFFGPFATQADRIAIDVLEEVASRCSQSGATVQLVQTPMGFEHSLDLQSIISRYEMGRSMASEWHTKPFLLGAVLLEEIQEARLVSDEAYLQAKKATIELSHRLDAVLAGFDILLTLATKGEAPAGLSSTGDATFNRSWSLLGLPCLSLPVAHGPSGLPLSVQLVGARHGDRKLLEVAHWIERIPFNL